MPSTSETIAAKEGEFRLILEKEVGRLYIRSGVSRTRGSGRPAERPAGLPFRNVCFTPGLVDRMQDVVHEPFRLNPIEKPVGAQELFAQEALLEYPDDPG